MNCFFFHSWKLDHAAYAPPREGNLNVTGASETHAERLVFGVTTEIYRCQKCGDVKTIEYLGKREK